MHRGIKGVSLYSQYKGINAQMLLHCIHEAAAVLRAGRWRGRGKENEEEVTDSPAVRKSAKKKAKPKLVFDSDDDDDELFDVEDNGW